MSDLKTRIAETLAEHKAIGLRGMGLHPIGITATCKCGVEVPGGPEGMRAHQAAELDPLIAEAQAEALREAADSLDAHADKNERTAVRTAWGTRANLNGTYWAVRRVRITARWLRARAAAMATP